MYNLYSFKCLYSENFYFKWEFLVASEKQVSRLCAYWSLSIHIMKLLCNKIDKQNQLLVKIALQGYGLKVWTLKIKEKTLEAITRRKKKHKILIWNLGQFGAISPCIQKCNSIKFLIQCCCSSTESQKITNFTFQVTWF